MHDSIGIPACFSSGEKAMESDPATAIRSGQSVFMSVYQTKIAGRCRFITITWCKNLLLHGLSVSVQGSERDEEYLCKIELKPWYFWRKQGSKYFQVDGRTVAVVWDLKAAKFNGETEPQSDYYVAIVSDEEVVLLVGDLKKDAFRKTGCRPALIDPLLVSKKEHVFGKKKYLTRIQFHERGKFHAISVECINGGLNCSDSDGYDPELDIRVDGQTALHVKHLQWKFRGNDFIFINQTRLEIYWDVHDWLFCSGPRNGLFIFRPVSFTSFPSSSVTTLPPPSLLVQDVLAASEEEIYGGGLSKFCQFLYAWKLE